jgi:hypothetical protein
MKQKTIGDLEVKAKTDIFKCRINAFKRAFKKHFGHAPDTFGYQMYKDPNRRVNGTGFRLSFTVAKKGVDEGNALEEIRDIAEATLAPYRRSEVTVEDWRDWACESVLACNQRCYPGKTEIFVRTKYNQ